MPKMSVARALGVACTLLAAFFFAKCLLDIDPAQLTELPPGQLVASVIGWSLVYGLLLAGVPFGFVQLVHATGHRGATPAEALVIWGKANMAKYLPGNVLHFAGRQLLGARFGWPQGSIAMASLLEMGLQLMLSCGIALSIVVLFGRWAMLEKAGDWVVPVILLATAGLALLLLARRLRQWLPEWLSRLSTHLALPHPAALGPAVVWYLLFFVGMCLIVWSLYAMVVGHATLRQLPVLSAAFLISWVMGFVIPGAPGGIGVREGSFALLGSVFLAADALVIVAVLMRLVTLLGEGLIFLVALNVGRSMAIASDDGALATQGGFAAGRPSVAREEIDRVVRHR